MKNVSSRFLFNNHNINDKLKILLSKNQEIDSHIEISINDFQYEIDSDKELIKVFIPIKGNTELLEMFDSMRVSVKSDFVDFPPKGSIGRYDFPNGNDKALVLILEPSSTDEKKDILPFLKNEIKLYKKYLDVIDAKVKKHNNQDLAEFRDRSNNEKNRKENFVNRFKK